MKNSAIAALLVASFTGVLIACSAEIDAAPNAEPLPAVDGGAATPDVPDASRPTTTPAACSQALAPLSCPTLGPAPSSEAAITKFVKDGAVPLRCTSEGSPSVWDVRALVDLYGSQRIFMMGEVHGTNEIGILSSILFEQLATQKKVNVLAYEIPMDFEAPLQRWIDSGDDPFAEQILERLAPNMFGSILTRTARELVKKGVPIRVAAVDYAYTTDLPVAAIEQVASKLTTQANTVLATLPTSTEQPPSAEDRTLADQYFDHIMASKDAICAELDPASCDRLVAMTHALWVATYSQGRENVELWFERREQVIYYNMKTAMASPNDRMFLHMGAAHTNKYEFSAGSRMAREFEPTKGKAFSVAPGYGDGSVIWYGGEEELPGEPLTLTSALTHAPDHPFFVSTTRPSTACQENPFGLEPEERTSSGSRAETYDGYIHYGRLTSEQSPSDTTFDREIAVVSGSTATMGDAAPRLAAQRFVAQRALVEEKERAVFAARRIRGAAARRGGR
jgi:hypothetical protein